MKLGAVRDEDVASAHIADHQAILLLYRAQRDREAHTRVKGTLIGLARRSIAGRVLVSL